MDVCYMIDVTDHCEWNLYQEKLNYTTSLSLVVRLEFD